MISYNLIFPLFSFDSSQLSCFDFKCGVSLSVAIVTTSCTLAPNRNRKVGFMDVSQIMSISAIDEAFYNLVFLHIQVP